MKILIADIDLKMKTRKMRRISRMTELSKKGKDMNPIENAIAMAIDDCIEEGILVDFLTENREFVIEAMEEELIREKFLSEMEKGDMLT